MPESSHSVAPNGRSMHRFRLRLTTGDPRVVLAAWMTAPDNPWVRAAGRQPALEALFRPGGWSRPKTILRSTNPATNPPLLDFLARRFVEANFRPQDHDAADHE